MKVKWTLRELKGGREKMCMSERERERGERERGRERRGREK